MKKLKIFLTVAITLGLVFLCAGLPKLTAMLMDGQSENSPVYNDMRPVELELNEGEDILPIMGKLSLLAHGKTLYIDEFHATRTKEEIVASVHAFLDACQEAGFYQGFTPPREVVRTTMAYDVRDPANCMVVWTYYTSKSDPVEMLSIMIDDETGKILSLSYEHYGTYTLDGIWERNRKIIDPFTDLYFAQLGLLEKAEAAEAAPETLYEYAEIDMGVTDVYYTLLDPTYGTVKILFDVGGSGTFRVFILKS